MHLNASELKPILKTLERLLEGASSRSKPGTWAHQVLHRLLLEVQVALDEIAEPW